MHILFFDKNTRIIADVEYFDRLTMGEKILYFAGKTPTRFDTPLIVTAKKLHMERVEYYQGLCYDVHANMA